LEAALGRKVVRERSCRTCLKKLYGSIEIGLPGAVPAHEHGEALDGKPDAAQRAIPSSEDVIYGEHGLNGRQFVELSEHARFREGECDRCAIRS
jgi:hypothetical protein